MYLHCFNVLLYCCFTFAFVTCIIDLLSHTVVRKTFIRPMILTIVLTDVVPIVSPEVSVETRFWLVFTNTNTDKPPVVCTSAEVR